MKSLSSFFSDIELAELEQQLDIKIDDKKDYSFDEIEEMYDKITEGFLYAYDDEGEPLELGKMFENIVDVLANILYKRE